MQHIKETIRHPAILQAGRDLFEAQGYFGAGLDAVAKKAGVSRQAIYLHFASRSQLLTALHQHINAIDVIPALDGRPIWTAPSALDALDAFIAASVEIVSKVWRIHEVLVTARRHHPEVDETLRPREEDRYAGILRLGRRMRKEGILPQAMPVTAFADVFSGLTSTARSSITSSSSRRSNKRRAPAQRGPHSTVRRITRVDRGACRAERDGHPAEPACPELCRRSAARPSARRRAQSH